MQDIDFLPSEYKHLHTRRQRQSWHVLVIVISIGLIAVGTTHQVCRRSSLNCQLEITLPHYNAAKAKAQRLVEMQDHYKRTTADAELITYLRHMWPRTQILSALIEPLPKDITLDEIKIAREHSRSADQKKYIPIAQQKAQEESSANVLPATRALEKLRSEMDPLKIVAIISGVTNDSVALHNYLAFLGQSNMFFQAELRSFEIDSRDKNGKLRFSAVAIVRPCYGQPNGPVKGTPNQSVRTEWRYQPLGTRENKNPTNHIDTTLAKSM